MFGLPTSYRTVFKGVKVMSKRDEFGGAYNSINAQENFNAAAKEREESQALGKGDLLVQIRIKPNGFVLLETPDGLVECHSEWQVAAIICRYAGHPTKVLQRTFNHTQSFEEWSKAGGVVKVAPAAQASSSKLDVNLTLEELGL